MMFSSVMRDLLSHNIPDLCHPNPRRGKGGGRKWKCVVLTIPLSLLFVCWLSTTSISRDCLCRYRYQSEFHQKEITRNWLKQLRELARQVQNSIGQLPGQAGNSAGADRVVHSLLASSSGKPVLLLRPFN